MELELFVKQRVYKYYWELDINCATTMLKVLAEFFEIELNPQVIDSAVGLHGAGGYGAQCGLVEGTLMFLGIWGKQKALTEERIIELCKEFAQRFEEEFGSLQCRILRPEGFKPDNPPHLGEPLTNRAIHFSINFIKNKEK